MRVAGFAVGLFLVAFLVHWLIWRIRIPHRQTAALLAIFFGFLPIGLAAMQALFRAMDWPDFNGWELLHISIFHTALSLAYIVVYSALEERSPSMTVLLHLAAAGP